MFDTPLKDSVSGEQITTWDREPVYTSPEGNYRRDLLGQALPVSD